MISLRSAKKMFTGLGTRVSAYKKSLLALSVFLVCVAAVWWYSTPMDPESTLSVAQSAFDSYVARKGLDRMEYEAPSAKSIAPGADAVFLSWKPKNGSSCAVTIAVNTRTAVTSAFEDCQAQPITKNKAG